MNRTTVRNPLAIGASITLLVVGVVVPGALVDFHAPVVDAVLQTAIALMGTLVAFLVVGRYRRNHDLGDLLLFFAVILLAWVHTVFKVLPDLISPASVGNGVSERIEIWGGSVARILAAWYVLRSTAERPMLASFSSWRRHRSLYAPAVVSVAALIALVAFVPVTHGGLTKGVPMSEFASVFVDFAGSLVFFAAAWRLTRESQERVDPFLSWIATGCIFGGFALLSSGLFGVGDGNWLQPSDLFRMGVVAVWAWGAVVEIRQYWSTISEVSRRDAQRTVALDLHDGMAQELALITSYLYAPEEERDQPEWHLQLQSTAERALAEMRRTITVLASQSPIGTDDLRGDAFAREPVGATLLATLNDPLTQEPVVRIVREAVTNALRHGRARTINVQLLLDGGPSLCVVDDGVGFDPTSVDHRGHLGIVSMREQAAVLGASLELRSTPGVGTTVEVRWP